MSSKKSIISMAVGSAFAVTLVPIVAAADNPFVMQSLDKGYMVADAHKYGEKKGGEGKCGEGTCGEGRCGAAMADANKDGKVTKEEYNAHHKAMFDHMDTNKDGVIDKDEMKHKTKEGGCGHNK